MTAPTPPDPYGQYPPAQQPSSPPPPSPYPPPQYPPGPYVPVPYAAVPVEPFTGLPYSDKSKLAAGLLQLLLGFFLGLGGVGRLYAGHTGLGVTQILLSLVGWAALCCSPFLWFPIVIFFGLWLWFVIDGIILLAGRPVDGAGRPLR